MKTVKEIISIAIIILVCEGILFSGFTPDAFADGSQNNCLSVVPITVSGTSVICPNTPQQRTTNESGTQYLSYPTDCGTSQGGTVVTSSAPPNYAGGNGGSQGTQSGGGTLPSGSSTVIASSTCAAPISHQNPCENNPFCGNDGPFSLPPPGGSKVGSSVDYLNGTYATSATDLKVPAKSIPIEISRVYRSNNIGTDDSGNLIFAPLKSSPFGVGWSTSLYINLIPSYELLPWETNRPF